MKSLARSILVSTGMVAIGLLGSATAAQAAPTGCTLETGVPSDGARVRCTSGSGEVRVMVECLLIKPGGDPITTTRPGPWVGVGATSSTTCSGGPRLSDAWYEVR
jgi:hypothetical protein